MKIFLYGRSIPILDEEIFKEEKFLQSLPRKYTFKFENKLGLPKSLSLFHTYPVFYVMVHLNIIIKINTECITICL